MDEGLGGIPRIELVSLYMNFFERLDEDERSAFEEEFLRRGLPLPARSAMEAKPSQPTVRPAAKHLDEATTRSYLYLINVLTGLFYSWYFLASRLGRRDIGGDPRHRAIQTLIALAYLALEAGVLFLVGAD
ncbi:MAG TPA: hypothetical protein PLB91_10600 [Spirochaetales bacterium]|nr:hypothetical protein [Spirochaetales bacterium]HRY54608.1 hypothetical protein [Spirochaetia bacterium]HRZ64290.1 hypothetical protein [Spirochaetia bacterium]